MFKNAVIMNYQRPWEWERALTCWGPGEGSLAVIIIILNKFKILIIYFSHLIELNLSEI